MITNDAYGKTVVECDNCHETSYEEDAIQAGWFPCVPTVSGRETTLDFCFICGCRVTDADLRLYDHIADDIEASK